MHEQSATIMIRAELCDRLAALQSAARAGPGVGFAESVRSIRRTAAAYGLTPVVRLADALERAGADDPGAAALYLDRLYDAIGCERSDEGASQAMLASVSVRLGR